jgi:hypothetical protein
MLGQVLNGPHPVPQVSFMGMKHAVPVQALSMIGACLVAVFFKIVVSASTGSILITSAG